MGKPYRFLPENRMVVNRRRACWYALPIAAGLIVLPARADFHVVEPRADLGEVKGGIRLAHRFELVNRGTTPVELVDVETSCGCLAPRLEPRRLAPAERGALTVHINTLGQAAGPHRWTARLRIRRGDRIEEVPLELAARVVTEVTVQPAALTVVAEGGIKQEVTVLDFRPQPLRVSEVAISSTRLRARLLPLDRAAGNQEGAKHVVARIAVESAPGLAPGRHDDLLNIYTSDPLYAHLQVPVTVIKNARGIVSASPAQVEMSLAAAGESASRLVRLRNHGEQPMAIGKIESGHPALTCTWARGPGHDATLKIQVNRRQVGEQALTAQIQVSLTSPQAAAVVIPVSITLD